MDDNLIGSVKGLEVLVRKGMKKYINKILQFKADFMLF
jgi:hypothetical protein